MRQSVFISLGAALLAIALLVAYSFQFYFTLDADCHDNLIIFAILYAGIGGLGVIASSISYAVNRCQAIEEPDTYDPNDPENEAAHNRAFCKTILRVVFTVFVFFVTAMTIAGLVVVGTTDTGGNYSECDRTLYLYTMWNVIGHSILIVLSIIILTLICSVPALYAHFVLREHIANQVYT